MGRENPETDANAGVDELLRESDAFVRCPDCETLLVRLGPHRCSSQRASPGRSREERARAAAADPRSDGASVGIVQRAAGSAYAYHELDENGRPLCNCVERPAVSGFEVVTRAEAKRRGRAPCGNCDRLQGANVGGESRAHSG